MHVVDQTVETVGQGGLACVALEESGSVSFQTEVSQPLQQAMVGFIERCPNWDQYRLVQAAIAGFLIQNGVDSREITRLYVGSMFRRESLSQGV